MITEELVQYVKSQLQNGQTKDAVRLALITSGWSEADAESAFQAVVIPNPLSTAPSVGAPGFGRTAKSFPTTIIVIIIILLILAGAAAIFIFGSFMKNNIKNKSSNEKTSYSSQPLQPPTTATPTKIPSDYDPLIKSITAEGWNRATFLPSPSGHGVSYTFYIPPTFTGQRGDQLSPQDSIDTIDQKVSTGQAEVFDQVAHLSSEGFQSFETMVQGAIPFSKEQPIVSDFTTASGLNGKKVTAPGELFNNAVQFVVILLHTGKQSDLGQEVVIKVSGTASYAGGSGHGTYTGSPDIIDKIAQTINL